MSSIELYFQTRHRDGVEAVQEFEIISKFVTIIHTKCYQLWGELQLVRHLIHSVVMAYDLAEISHQSS